MTDDIRSMSAALAADPGNLVFLELGEVLRRRGQLDAALKVATAGATRHPGLADARDLCARIHSDLGDGESAFDAWLEALQIDAEHLGAHKGLGFLYYRSGDLPRALRHLELAAASAPDARLDVAIARVRAALEAAQAASAPAPDRSGTAPAEAVPPRSASDDGYTEVFAGFDAARDGLLLLDANGLRLGGGVRNRAGQDVSDAVAALAASLAGRLRRTTESAGLSAPAVIHMRAEAGSLLAVPAEDDLLVVVVARADANIGLARLEMIAAAREIA